MGEHDSKRRPWGVYQVIDEGPRHKVKRITVHRGERLSHQFHLRRAEHWFVVAGRGLVTLDRHDFQVEAGDTVDVAIGMAHRIENVGDDDLVFIEVQSGEYFGEDDIVRLDDDYGRVAPV